MSVLTITTNILMQEDRRGESPRKQLRLPAIAPKDDQSSSSSTRSGRVVGPALPPRARLPPRSRTGCWTCRQRKVKCDEGRPVCGQCGRLGHACDYSPRLSFRDDTLRVVERMQDVTTAGSNVWDGQPPFGRRRRQSTDLSIAVSSPAPSSSGSAIADDLPPFSALMTDEERERKAEASSPGTYNVVVNPESFQHLPEYSDDIEVKRERLSPLRRGSLATSLPGSLRRDSIVEGVPVPGDPNTVILSRFEDLSRRSTREVKSPVSPVSQSRRIEAALEVRIKQEKPDDGDDDDDDDDKDHGNEDSKNFQHFRTVVWRQLAPSEDIARSSFGQVEKVANNFPPLFHAILAVASQSSAQHEQKESVDALQHYTQAIEFLKPEEDLASDGVFLTHFLILIYEIATADIEHSHLRTNQLHTLTKITQLRRQTLATEQFPYIIWWICNIDLDILLSGLGAGQFMSQLLENETIPPPSFHLYPLGADGSSLVLEEERTSLPVVLQLDYDITLLAFQLAQLSQEFRQDESIRIADARQRDMMVRLRQSRMFEIQESLRRRWTAPSTLATAERALSIRPRRVWEHAFALYRASLIFSHTSMWSAQRLDTSADFDEEIAAAVTEILQLAQSLIYNGHLECRFLVFPVFIAGFASTDGQQKMVALDLLTQMEQESIGRNIVIARQAMEAIYEKQNEQFMVTGHSLDVDWIEIMVEKGLSVVNFGM